MNYSKSIILFMLLFCFNIFSQNPPPDFKLVATAAGEAPWEVTETITILANGEVNFYRHEGEGSLETLLDTSFTINVSQVQQIWQAVQNNNFFSLNSNYQDSARHDGSFALFTITANGNTKQVSVKNTLLTEIQNIISSINANVPSEYNLNYNVPEKLNIVPTDPCGNSIGFQSLLKEIPPKIFTDKTEAKNDPAASSLDEIQIPHGGVEIGYQMSLFDAIATGRASLRSKGEFFGDGVSITGDNTKNFPPNDNTIHIKLNLEFYGPCDNAANEQKIINDILIKWDGQTTSDGKELKMEVVSLSHPGASSPSGTPGFNNIKLECEPVRSFVDPLGIPNSTEVSGGTWYTSEREGVYAHEAGHLMGLEDQYEDWNKQPDGSWTSSSDGTNLSNTDFMNFYNDKYGSNHDASKFDKVNKLSVPQDGHEDDLMANRSKAPLQSDIDYLAFQAGLIIKINAGDIFTSTKVFRQSLVAIHTGDLFLAPGQTKTLEGIYTACIDNARIPPNNSEVLNIAPSLDKWNGVPAAGNLLKLVRYTDSMRYYCGNIADVQFAVWRITDNASNGSIMMDSIFINAGIDPGIQLFYFPTLVDDLPDDTLSNVVVPKELFIPEISPQSIQGQIGQKLDFNSTISGPEGFNYTTNFSWILNKPEGSISQISSEGSFIPDKRGLYTVSVNINVTDPLNQSTEYISDKGAFASVADKFTETFEHQNITDWFEWETYGDKTWEITDETSHTGNYSAKAGDVSGGNSSTLAINVNLPADTLITFAVRTFSNNAGALFFEVDSVMIDYWGNSDDWQMVEFDLTAGLHRLTWTFKNNNIVNPAQVWLDNIFFPANSVVTGIEPEEKIPLTFNLFQNYPNPFNPSTKIKYTIPATLPVKAGIGGRLTTLKVYDILGKEIAVLVNEAQPSGEYEIEFDASGLSSGIYFYKLQTDSFIETKKMMLLK